MLTVSSRLGEAYPGARVGVLQMDKVENPLHSTSLEAAKEELTREIRERLPDRAAIANLETVRAYTEYYRRFKKTYHVQLQLESVALKGKTIPSVAALVEAMFMAELKNVLLTAGHDATAIRLPLVMDLARGDELYTRLNGEEQLVKADDMILRDGEGVIGSVIYGPDRRTCLTPDTQSALFIIYVPPGISEAAVYRHLQDIADFVKLVTPGAEVRLQQVVSTR